MAVAHLIEQFTCRLYGLKFQGLYLSKGSGKMEKIQKAVAHLIEQLTCRLNGLKFWGLNLPQGSGKMEEKIQRKWQ